MGRCIQLAKNGLGTTYPNPLVGCVLVLHDTIIGEGWHYKAGQAHAEVNAIRSVPNKTELNEATLYVSLEPCSHYGKTPPCADFIVSNGIKKVVVGTTDPNPKVAGNGIKILMESGCDVVVGVLEPECNELNKRFFTFQQKNRPYIFLKWAQTRDGFIAPEKRNEQKPVWITNTFARQLSHKLRTQEQAILVGTNTVRADNPSLTARDWHGTSPTRVVLDAQLSLPHDLHVFNDREPTLVLTKLDGVKRNTIRYEKVVFDSALPQQICDVLHKHNIQSVIVEGGSQTLQTFIDANIWDEAYVYEGTSTFSAGIEAPILQSTMLESTPVVSDLLHHYKNMSH